MLFFDLFSRSAPAPVAANDDEALALAYAHRKAVGSTGTEIHSGYDTEEYLWELRGSERAKIFDRMRRGDPQCKMLLKAVKDPIKSATWEIEAADDSPEAQADRDLIKHILFDNPCKSFEKVKAEALTCVDFGHAVIEKTYKLVQSDPTFGTYHSLAGLDLISPKTIERWNIDPTSKQLSSITQQAQGDLGVSVDIARPYFMLFNVDMEGSNYEGISWLRAVYGNWVRKAVYTKLNAIGIEKYAVPTPRVQVPDGFHKTPSYGSLIAALDVYSSGESNYLIYPESVKLEIDSANNYDPQKVDATIDAEDRRMAKCFLANFLELGLGGGSGSFSLGNDLSDFFLAGLTYIGMEISEPFNQQLIPELIRMNRGVRQKYPRLKVSGIDDKAGAELANALSTLVNAKVVVPDGPLEDNMRKRFGFPAKSDLDQRVPDPKPSFGFQLAEQIAKRARR